MIFQNKNLQYLFPLLIICPVASVENNIIPNNNGFTVSGILGGGISNIKTPVLGHLTVLGGYEWSILDALDISLKAGMGCTNSFNYNFTTGFVLQGNMGLNYRFTQKQGLLLNLGLRANAKTFTGFGTLGYSYQISNNLRASCGLFAELGNIYQIQAPLNIEMLMLNREDLFADTQNIELQQLLKSFNPNALSREDKLNILKSWRRNKESEIEQLLHDKLSKPSTIQFIKNKASDLINTLKTQNQYLISKLNPRYIVDKKADDPLAEKIKKNQEGLFSLYLSKTLAIYEKQQKLASLIEEYPWMKKDISEQASQALKTDISRISDSQTLFQNLYSILRKASYCVSSASPTFYVIDNLNNITSVDEKEIDSQKAQSFLIRNTYMDLQIFVKNNKLLLEELEKYCKSLQYKEESQQINLIKATKLILDSSQDQNNIYTQQYLKKILESLDLSYNYNQPQAPQKVLKPAVIGIFFGLEYKFISQNNYVTAELKEI